MEADEGLLRYDLRLWLPVLQQNLKDTGVATLSYMDIQHDEAKRLLVAYNNIMIKMHAFSLADENINNPAMWFIEEAEEYIDDSVILAASGCYTSAIAMLRLSLELFCNCLRFMNDTKKCADCVSGKLAMPAFSNNFFPHQKKAEAKDLYTDLCNFTHVKGKAFRQAAIRGLPVPEFSERGLLAWLGLLERTAVLTEDIF